MLISNKIHYFRNFFIQKYKHPSIKTKKCAIPRGVTHCGDKSPYLIIRKHHAIVRYPTV